MQSRYWCITDNVHVDQAYWEAKLEACSLQFIVAQPESGDEKGHLHVQAFAVYPTRRRFGVVREHFPGAHVEAMRGTPEQAAAYCRKEDTWTGEWRVEMGDLPEREQGRRNDIEQVRDMIKAGSSLLDVIDKVPSAIRYLRFMQMYKNLLLASRTGPSSNICLRGWQQELFAKLNEEPSSRRIWWIWSAESATGKTTTMSEYVHQNPGRVLIGTRKLADLLYAFCEESHKVIWFDLSRSDPLDAEMTTLLEQVSNGTYLLSSKYESTMKRVCAHIVVTCNRPPPLERLPNRITEFALNANGDRVERVVVDAAPHWYNPDFYYNLQ